MAGALTADQAGAPLSATRGTFPFMTDCASSKILGLNSLSYYWRTCLRRPGDTKVPATRSSNLRDFEINSCRHGKGANSSLSGEVEQ